MVTVLNCFALMVFMIGVLSRLYFLIYKYYVIVVIHCQAFSNKFRINFSQFLTLLDNFTKEDVKYGVGDTSVLISVT